MDINEIKKQLETIVYQTFESGHFDFFRATNAANIQRNEVQFRLTKNISNLAENDSMLDSIYADINLSYSMGWMTDESFNKSLKLIEGIN